MHREGCWAKSAFQPPDHSPISTGSQKDPSRTRSCVTVKTMSCLSTNIKTCLTMWEAPNWLPFGLNCVLTSCGSPMGWFPSGFGYTIPISRGLPNKVPAEPACPPGRGADAALPPGAWRDAENGMTRDQRLFLGRMEWLWVKNGCAQNGLPWQMEK